MAPKCTQACAVLILKARRPKAAVAETDELKSAAPAPEQDPRAYQRALAHTRQGAAIAKALAFLRTGEPARSYMELNRALSENSICRSPLLAGAHAKPELVELYKLHLQVGRPRDDNREGLWAGWAGSAALAVVAASCGSGCEWTHASRAPRQRKSHTQPAPSTARRSIGSSMPWTQRALSRPTALTPLTERRGAAQLRHAVAAAGAVSVGWQTLCTSVLSHALMQFFHTQEMLGLGQEEAERIELEFMQATSAFSI
jgi:hypothetical protein